MALKNGTYKEISLHPRGKKEKVEKRYRKYLSLSLLPVVIYIKSRLSEIEEKRERERFFVLLGSLDGIEGRMMMIMVLMFMMCGEKGGESWEDVSLK